jgi:predicted nuclease with TOPRIM domain
MADYTPVKFHKFSPEKRPYSRSLTRVRHVSSSRGGYASTAATERKAKPSLSPLPAQEPKSVLGKLRSRVSAGSGDKVMPAVAASIIKDYVLPLFEADCRKQTLIRRSSEKGLTRKFSNGEGNSGTLYAEMKLSDKLGEHLTDLRMQNAELIKQLNEQTQVKESCKKEVDHLRSQVNALQTGLQTSFNFTEELQSQLQSLQLNSSVLTNELKELRVQHKSEVKKNLLLNEKYIAVLGNYNEVNYSHVMILQEKKLLQIQFEIVTTSMRNLKQIMTDVQTYKTGFDKVFLEKSLIVKDFDRQKDWIDFLCKEYERIFNLRKVEQMNLSLMDTMLTDVSGQREKALKFLIKKNEQLSTTLNSELKENADLVNKLKEITKKYEALSGEFRTLWRTHTNVKKTVRGEFDRCKRCDRMYREIDNFNWSCRVHTSSFDAFWLCCGASKQAPGCSTSKHQPMDEIDKLNLGGAGTKEIVRERCVNCKQFGHEAASCSKDPNSLAGLGLHSTKDKPLRSCTLTADSLRLLRSKLGDYGMTKDDLGSPSNSSEGSDGNRRHNLDLNVKMKLKESMKIRDVLSSLADLSRSETLIQIMDFSRQEPSS